MTASRMPPNMIPKGIASNSDADKKAETEFRRKYPDTRLSNKDILQRSVSHGGKQYFDSGDYNMKKKKGPIQGIGGIPQYLQVGKEVATPHNIPTRKTSQKSTISASPKRSSTLIGPLSVVSTPQTEAIRDVTHSLPVLPAKAVSASTVQDSITSPTPMVTQPYHIKPPTTPTRLNPTQGLPSSPTDMDDMI